MLRLAHPYYNCCRTFKKADATFISYINLFVINGSQAFIQIFKLHLLNQLHDLRAQKSKTTVIMLTLSVQKTAT